MKNKLLSFIMLFFIMINFIGCEENQNIANKEASSQVFTLAIEITDEEHISEAALAAAEHFKSLSNSAFELKYDFVENPFDAILDGSADFAYISNSSLSDKIELYSLFTTPFYFSSPEEGIATLNSESFHKIISPINTTFGIKLICSVYTDSALAVSNFSEIENLEQIEQSKVILDNCDEFLDLISVTDIDYTISTQLIPDDMYTEDPTVLIINDMLISALGESDFNESLYLVESPLINRYSWVIADEAFLNEMSDDELAIINEAFSHFSGYINSYTTLRHSENIYRLTAENLSLADCDFENLSEEVSDIFSEKLEENSVLWFDTYRDVGQIID